MDTPFYELPLLLETLEYSSTLKQRKEPLQEEITKYDQDKACGKIFEVTLPNGTITMQDGTLVKILARILKPK